jgi:hypothetical protein
MDVLPRTEESDDLHPETELQRSNWLKITLVPSSDLTFENKNSEVGGPSPSTTEEESNSFVFCVAWEIPLFE